MPLGLENVDLAAVSSSNEFAVFSGPRPSWMTLAPSRACPVEAALPSPSRRTVVCRGLVPLGRAGDRAAHRSALHGGIPHRQDTLRGDTTGVDRRRPGLAPRGSPRLHPPPGRRAHRRGHGHRPRREDAPSLPSVASAAWSCLGPRERSLVLGGRASCPNTIQALPPRGPERSIYGALNPIVLHDISPDGRALVGQGICERDITFLGEGAPNPRSLSLNERDSPARLSTGWSAGALLRVGSRTHMVAMLRKTSGAPPQTLGPGEAIDLSPDGRTALLLSGDDVLTRGGD